MDHLLRRLQLTQLEILKVFDGFCRKHHLSYSLYAGSLLGAVRHGGFIPWDDDLDVCMTRAEYDRFLSLWTACPVEEYVLQNKENAPGFTQSFTKLRKDHTTFLQNEQEAGHYHTGIFLDIFPVDRMPNGKWNRAVFKARCMLYQLMTREFVPPKGSAGIRLGAKVILACIPKGARPQLRQNLLQKITKYNADASLPTVFIETVSTMDEPYDPDLMEVCVELPFEDGKFWCTANWDAYLSRKYGNYMELPAEEERVWKHHPTAIDFERNDEELKPR